MACLSDEKILAYSEGSLNAIEAACLRDHLLLCPNCRQTADHYRDLERALFQPVLLEPPARLVPQVMQRLYPALPRLTSIAAMIAASFLFLVTWIYIYFDFSSNSMIQALRLATDGTTGWLAGTIKAISTIYSGTQGIFKAFNTMLNIVLPARLTTIVIAVVLLAASGLLVLFRLKPGLKETPGTKS
jgi:predicted anti-sigma-YlaC factor YlaD